MAEESWFDDGYDSADFATEELLRAQREIENYQSQHPFRTRKWHFIGRGIVERVTDKPYAEWEQVPGVVIGIDISSEVKPKTRRAVNAVLEAAGVGNVPVEFIEMSQSRTPIGNTIEA